MFTKKTREKNGLDHAIDKLLEDMSKVSSTEEDYATMVAQLEKLYKLKETDFNVAPKPVSSDTLAIVVGNLAGILLIIGHERANVLTSKALNFVLKAR